MPIHALNLFWGDVRTWTLVGEIPFLGFIIALYLGGRQQGWPWRAALLATAAFVAGLGVGTSILPSVLGAVGGGIAVWILAQKTLGLRQPPLVVLTLGLVALIAVGRWGCLLNGCCFGTLTDLPWGVRYAVGSSPHFLHQSLGLLADGAQQSLPVHPYPAYESLGLFLWLPFAYWLGRHLRSKGALLAFSAAFDLGLRGLIDGSRAMVNVWWSLLGAWHGINLFQWALLAGAATLLLLGLLLEYRARRTTVFSLSPILPSEAGANGSYRLWLVYLGLLALGWVSDSGQTAFLHRALLVALAAGVPALALPRGLGSALRARSELGYAVGGVLVIVLGIHLETRAHAVVPDGDPAQGMRRRGSTERRTWLYAVDQRRGVMVRLGNDSDDDLRLEHRELTLGLPSLAVRAKLLAAQELSPSVQYTPIQPRKTPNWQTAPDPGVPPSTESARRSHTWVGGGFHGGSYSRSDAVKSSNGNSSSDSCSGNTYTTTTTRERLAWGGWGQVEQQLSHSSDSVFWIGGRAGVIEESQQERVESTDPSVRTSASNRSLPGYYLNLWGEYETPSLAFGLSVLGNYGGGQKTALLPGFHLRAGSPRFGVDLGFADRMSFLSPQSGHLGFSVAIRRGDQILHPNDALARMVFGLFFFPGADLNRFDLAPGLGAEIFVTPRVVLGFNAAIFVNQGFGGIHLRTVVGP